MPPSPGSASGDGRPHRATLCFEYDAERRARVVAASVAVEVDGVADARSRADVRREDDRLEVVVGADDLVALRAGLNSWMRLVETAESVASAGDSAATDGAGGAD